MAVLALAPSEMAAIVESADEALIGAFPDCIVRSWNPCAARPYGYVAEETIDRVASMLVPASRQEEVPELLESIGSGERVDQFRTVNLRKDGSMFPVSLSLSPVTDNAGSAPVATRSLLRDRLDRQVKQSRTRSETLRLESE